MTATFLIGTNRYASASLAMGSALLWVVVLAKNSNILENLVDIGLANNARLFG